MEKISISKVRHFEAEALRAMSIETFADTYKAKNDPSHFEMHIQEAFDLKKLSDELNNKDSFFFFIKIDNQNCGYIKLNIGDSQTEAMELHFIELERIYVISSQKGKGLGSRLINFACDFGKKKGYRKLWLGVWDQNPEAVSFYKKMGFQITGTHIFTLGSDEQTDYMMEIDL